MKLSESCLVVCALVASLRSAGAAEADDFKTLYARADLGGSMRGTALMRGPSRIKEQKSLARDKAIKEREAKERQQDKSGTSRKDGPIIPIFKAPAGFEDLGRSKKFGHDQGIRWAPHKGKMIPLSEWNEDEYQEWRAHHYMSCYQKVQDMRDRHAQAELPNLRNISGAWK